MFPPTFNPDIYSVITIAHATHAAHTAHTAHYPTLLFNAFTIFNT